MRAWGTRLALDGIDEPVGPREGRPTRERNEQQRGVAIAVFSILFIFVNWDVTPISFIFFKVSMPLTIALALTFIGGMATGALIMRRRARS